jgi:hypothetical protein
MLVAGREIWVSNAMFDGRLEGPINRSLERAIVYSSVGRALVASDDPSCKTIGHRVSAIAFRYYQEAIDTNLPPAYLAYSYEQMSRLQLETELAPETREMLRIRGAHYARLAREGLR